MTFKGCYLGRIYKGSFYKIGVKVFQSRISIKISPKDSQDNSSTEAKRTW